MSKPFKPFLSHFVSNKENPLTLVSCFEKRTELWNFPESTLNKYFRFQQYGTPEYAVHCSPPPPSFSPLCLVPELLPIPRQAASILATPEPHINVEH